MASVGINAVSINNVNISPPAHQLITMELLPQLKKIADLWRPFGIRLIVSVDFALPVIEGLPTADPLDEQVLKWWRTQVAKVYEFIPDLCGFLIKADSEFRPGPHLYGRNHAQGANAIAQALEPYGGVLIWRCFVYNCRQDWRDRQTDRPKAAYETYTPLEGEFDHNVILQIKYGPYDFQVREPVSPLFFAMPTTQKALELQLTQEYTGHQIDLYYMLPQWQEILTDLSSHQPKYISAVCNVGDDANWTGHDLAQANLFAYGQFAWNTQVDKAFITRMWVRLTLGKDEAMQQIVTRMLLRSREVYEGYNAPLALGWMVRPEGHYGPSPEGYEYSAWGTYIRANREAIGIDRSEKGTGFALQYPSHLAQLYNDVTRCPQALLLFFHRLCYDYLLPNGKTLVQHVYDTHFDAAKQVEEMLVEWEHIKTKVAEETYENVLERFKRQLENACQWRDVINTYFYRYSGIPDQQGREIYS